MTTSLKHAKSELAAGEAAITRMRKSRMLDELESEWKTFLFCMEKVWVKTELECGPVKSRFLPWQGKFSRDRKKDPLLRYIKHARNSDNHTIQALIEQKPGQYEARIEGPVGIDKLVVKDGIVVEYQGSKPLEIITLPERVELIRVKDRGKWYNPPKEHLSTRLLWPDPLQVAELGLSYYRNFVQETENKFFK